MDSEPKQTDESPDAESPEVIEDLEAPAEMQDEIHGGVSAMVATSLMEH